MIFLPKMKIYENNVFYQKTFVCSETKQEFCRRKKEPCRKSLRLPARHFVSSQVFRINFSRHLGQVMEIFPFPLGTRTVWRHLGQLK